MNTTMQPVIVHRAPRGREAAAGVAWSEVCKLALVVSVIAVLASVAVSAVADVSSTVVVMAVIVAGFAVSWLRTTRDLA